MSKRGSKAIERANSESSKKQKKEDGVVSVDSNATTTTNNTKSEDSREHKAPALGEHVLPTSEYTGLYRLLLLFVVKLKLKLNQFFFVGNFIAKKTIDY